MLEKFKKSKIVVACGDENNLHIFLKYLVSQDLSFPNNLDAVSFVNRLKYSFDEIAIGFHNNTIRCCSINDMEVRRNYNIIYFEQFFASLIKDIENPKVETPKTKKIIMVKCLGI